MQHSHTKPSVLCVDDVPGVISALERELTLFGCKVFTATCGRQACDILERENIDVMITDASMPGMSGIQLLKRATIISPATMRIMLTAHCSNEEIVVPAVNEGEIYRLLAKPWTREMLFSAVAESLSLSLDEWTQRYGVPRIRMTPAQAA